MRTKGSASSIGWFTGAAILALMGLVVFGTMTATQTIAGRPAGLPTADKERLPAISFGELPNVTSTAEQGKAVAKSLYNFESIGAQATTYLASVTDTESLRSA